MTDKSKPADIRKYFCEKIRIAIDTAIDTGGVVEVYELMGDWLLTATIDDDTFEWALSNQGFYISSSDEVDYYMSIEEFEATLKRVMA